jgi:hypothetical protein
MTIESKLVSDKKQKRYLYFITVNKCIIKSKGGYKMKIYPVLEITLAENQMSHINLIEIYTSLDDAINHKGSVFDSFEEIDIKEFDKLANKWNLSILNPCKIFSAVCNGSQFYWAVLTGKHDSDEIGWNIPTNK